MLDLFSNESFRGSLEVPNSGAYATLQWGSKTRRIIFYIFKKLEIIKNSGKISKKNCLVWFSSLNKYDFFLEGFDNLLDTQIKLSMANQKLRNK